MKHSKHSKLFRFFSILVSATAAALLGTLLPLQAEAQENYFAQIFSEKVLTVSSESDHILPGTLRSALIQANGIRSQNAFTLVRIVFDPAVKRVRVNKGPLPEISGSLTTLDCQNPQGRVLIEAAYEPNPAESVAANPEANAGLRLLSNGNTVRNCHFSGFKGPGIYIRGNRNVIEYNTLGYHSEVPESSLEGMSFGEEPKSNQAVGLLIGEASSENLIQNNDIVANGSGGVEIGVDAGVGNQVTFNFFAKNSGRPIQVMSKTHATPTPQLTKIVPEGDHYLISGVAEANTELQIYLVGREDSEIGMIVIPGARLPHKEFTILTKNKGFIPKQSKIIALAHSQNRNSSEFSNVLVIPEALENSKGKIPPSSSNPPPREEAQVPSTPPAKIETNKAEEKDEVLIDLNGLGTSSHAPDLGELGKEL